MGPSSDMDAISHPVRSVACAVESGCGVWVCCNSSGHDHTFQLTMSGSKVGGIYIYILYGVGVGSPLPWRREWSCEVIVGWPFFGFIADSAVGWWEVRGV